ncbi:MAG: hypothetical protein ACHQF0_00600 [Chitinophagales bacterium]
MGKISFLSLAILFSEFLYSQQVVGLEENSSYKSNGLEYGYYITNEQSKEVKGEDFDRYEVNLFVTNNSGCIKIIPFKTGITPSSDEDVTIAEFTCQNATGKRLTAKGGKIQAKPWYTQVKISDEKESNKYKLINAQVGYAVGNGQTLTTKIIVIVPKGERPKINCRTVYFPGI